MTQHIVAEKYEELLAKAQELARFYSGRKWSVDIQHDPGLTTLQILANALSLNKENYERALQSNSLFKAVRNRTRWQANPQIEDGLRFHQNSLIFLKDDFKTMPAVQNDICRAVEDVAGVARAWLTGLNGMPELIYETAPALSVPTGSLPVQAIDFEKYKDRPEWQVHQEVQSLMSDIRGLGQPVLPARKAAFKEIQVSLHIRLKNGPGYGGHPKISSAFLAKLMVSAAEFLRPEEEPKRCITSADLYDHLCTILDETAIEVAGLRLLDLPSDGMNQPTDVIKLELGPEHDALRISSWQVVINPGPDQIELSEQELAYGAFIADRMRLEKLWPKWFTCLKHDQGNTYAEPVEFLKNDFLHRQFPPFYHLDDRDQDLSGQSPSQGQAEVLQFQGLLFLFEEILNDTEIFMTDPEYLFLSPDIHETEPTRQRSNPLFEKLVDSAVFEKKFVELLHKSGRSRNLLLYLAALQGEDVWFRPEQIHETAADTDIPVHQWYDHLLSSWLRQLPLLNGCRLQSRFPNRAINSTASESIPLERRLELLLSPFQTKEPRPDQYFFDMRKSHNKISGRDEYRCYIHDRDGRLRLIVKHKSSSPEEAESMAFLALRQAARPSHYWRCDGVIRVGWLAELPEGEDKKAVFNKKSWPLDSESMAESIQWADSLLPPWVKVVEYLALDENRPFEIAVLLETESIPSTYQVWLTDEILKHVPAHILPHVFFISNNERRWVESYLDDGGESGSNYTYKHRNDLLNFLNRLQENIQKAS